MSGAKVFSTIDLTSGYHQMRMEESSRKYTAIRTHNEWLVAPMGLADMGGSSLRLTRMIFAKPEFQDIFVVYLDNICVFSSRVEIHFTHLRVVLQVLNREKLYLRKEKCSFVQDRIEFLGHVVSANGLDVDSRKVEAIVLRLLPLSDILKESVT
uniref:Reverse transcriptase domain-containing protein n=1 Tax=Peronospora matthiolae TaxID=2874970 RepID=A0AAV1UTN8_9STRA